MLTCPSPAKPLLFCFQMAAVEISQPPSMASSIWRIGGADAGRSRLAEVGRLSVLSVVCNEMSIKTTTLKNQLEFAR